MTPRQRKFCDEYLISGNATDAAIKGGVFRPRPQSRRVLKTLQNLT